MYFLLLSHATAAVINYSSIADEMVRVEMVRSDDDDAYREAGPGSGRWFFFKFNATTDYLTTQTPGMVAAVGGLELCNCIYQFTSHAKNAH